MVALAGSLARGKIFAVALGTSGVGILAQLANFAALLTGLSTLGLSTAGITLLGREEGNNNDQRRRIVSTIVLLPIAMSVILALAAAFASGPLSRILLGSPHHRLYVVLAAASVPANVVSNGYQIVLQGHRRAWRTTWNSAISAVAMVAAVALLVVPFGIVGGALSVLATSVAAAIVVLVRERAVTAEVLPPRKATAAVNRTLVQFGVASLIAGSATSVVDLVLRSALVRHSGTAANGIYQPAYLLGTLIFAQLGAGLIAAVTPGLSAAWRRGDTTSATVQICGALQLSLLSMVPLILVGTAFRTALIATVFSHSFVGAAPVLALALTAELPRAVTYAIGGLLLPAGRIRAWTGMGVSADALRLVVGLILLDALGAEALAIALLVDWLFMATTTIIMVKRLGIRLGRQVSARVIVAAIVVAATYTSTRISVNQTVTAVILIAIAAGWVCSIATTRQRQSATAAPAAALSLITSWRRIK